MGSMEKNNSGSLTWGRHAVIEALEAGHPVNRIYLARKAGGRDIERVKALARERRVRFDFVDVGRLGRMTGTRDHQDVAARLSPVSYVRLSDLLTRLAALPKVTLVALDRLQHAGNVGMAIRTAAGAGADAVLLPTRGGRLVNDEVVRASAGTVYRLPIVASPNLVHDLLTLKEHRYWVYGLEGGAPQSLYEIAWPPRRVVVAGNETSGLRPLIHKTVDATVGIPLCAGLDSLNVAVALGVVLFEMRRAGIR